MCQQRKRAFNFESSSGRLKESTSLQHEDNLQLETMLIFIITSLISMHLIFNTCLQLVQMTDSYTWELSQVLNISVSLQRAFSFKYQLFQSLLDTCQRPPEAEVLCLLHLQLPHCTGYLLTVTFPRDQLQARHNSAIICMLNLTQQKSQRQQINESANVGITR